MHRLCTIQVDSTVPILTSLSQCKYYYMLLTSFSVFQFWLYKMQGGRYKTQLLCMNFDTVIKDIRLRF